MSIWDIILSALNQMVPIISTALAGIIAVLLGRLALALGHNKYVDVVTDAVKDVVVSLNAEIVDKAKSDGVFTKEEQACVLALAIDKVKSMVGSVALKGLALAKVDLETLITTKINSTVETVKMERLSNGTAAVNNTQYEQEPANEPEEFEDSDSTLGE